MRKALLAIIIVVLAFLGLYIIDFPIQRTISFDSIEATYDWRLFDNLYCNSKSGGHCFTNGLNRANASLEIYRKLLEDYNGQPKVKEYIENSVSSTYRLHRIYIELTGSSEVNIDTIVNVKSELLKPIMLK
jgi:hypothetical protein